MSWHLWQGGTFLCCPHKKANKEAKDKRGETQQEATPPFQVARLHGDNVTHTLHHLSAPLWHIEEHRHSWTPPPSLSHGHLSAPLWHIEEPSRPGTPLPSLSRGHLSAPLWHIEEPCHPWIPLPLLSYGHLSAPLWRIQEPSHPGTALPTLSHGHLSAPLRHIEEPSHAGWTPLPALSHGRLSAPLWHCWWDKDSRQEELKTLHPKETFCTDHLLKLFLPHWKTTYSDTSSFRQRMDLKEVHFVQSSFMLNSRNVGQKHDNQKLCL